MLFDAPPLNFGDDGTSNNSYDYLLHLEGGGSHQGILRFRSNEGQLTNNDPTAPAAGPLLWEEFHSATNLLWDVRVADGAPMNGAADYWLTIGVDWDLLTPYGLTPGGATVVWIGTSTSNQAINRDFACHDGDTLTGLTLEAVGSDPGTLDPGFDACEEDNLCSDNSTCQDLGSGAYQCICFPGYVGEFCDEFEACSSPVTNNCAENTAECVDLPGGDYECLCEAGWEGEFCEVPIDPCADAEICGVGVCEETGPGTYVCDCPEGYDFQGGTCVAIDFCEDVDPEVCGDNGDCDPTGPGTYICECDEGYEFDGVTCIAEVTLDSPVDGLLTNDPRTIFDGTGEPGATITISINGATVGATEVEADGTWSWTPDEDLPEGEVTVVVTDGLTDAEVTITVDTIAPDVEITEPGDGQVLDASPAMFVGMAEPGVAIALTLDGIAYGSTTADGDGDWEVAVTSTLGNGTYVLVAQATDGAGNVSSDTATFIVDTTADLIITQPSNGARVRTSTPTVTGTAEPGNEVDIFVNGVPVDTVTANDDGDWSWTTPTEFPDGMITVSAETDSPSGLREASVTFEVDTAFTEVTIESPSSGDLLNEARPTVTGSAAAAAEVTVSLNGQVQGTVVADSNGVWSWTPTSDLPQGDNTVTANTVDDGIPSEASVTFEVDTIPPTVAILVPGADEVLTESPTVFSGEAEADATVELFLDGELYGTTTADGDGAWEIAVVEALDNGTYVVVAVATDAAENTAEDTVTFVVDTTADLVITQPTEGERVRTSTPTIAGEAEPGNEVDIYLDGVFVDTVTADEDGDWTYTFTDEIVDGEVTVTAETDSPSGIRETSVTFEVDTSTTPVSITSPSEDDQINDPTPTFTGTAEPGAEITISVNGEVQETVTTLPDGTWSWTPDTALPEGENTVTVVADDDSIITEDTVTFTIDTIAPAITIREPGDGDVLTASPLAFAGDSEAEVQIDLFLNGEEYGTTTADEDGEWEFEVSPELENGTYVLVARATDAAGNQSEDTVTFIVDTTADLFITQPTEGDRVRTATPTISGTAEPGNEVDIYIDGVLVGTVTTDQDGNWSYTVTDDLADGQVTVTVETESPSGTQETSVTFEVDTTTTQVTIESPGPGELLNDARPTVTGTAEPGATVTVILNGEEVGTVTADANGNWSWTPDSNLPQGENTVTAVADDDGIETEATVTFEVDTVPPSLVVNSPQDGEELPAEGNVVTGTSEPGAVIEVLIDGEPVGSTTADENGDWSVPMPDDLDPGEHDLRVTATDEAGNVSVVERVFIIEDEEEERLGMITGGGLAACSATGGDPALLGFFLVFLGFLGLRRRREEEL